MKAILIFLCSYLLFYIPGCSPEEEIKEDIENPEENNNAGTENTGLSFSLVGETTQRFTADGGSSQVTFSTSKSWTAEVADTRAVDWCEVSPKSGPAGSETLTFTVQPNDSYDERRATVTLKTGSLNEEFFIIQKQKDALLVSSDKVEMAIEGGEISVEVQSNLNYTCSIDADAQSWIIKVETRGLTSHTECFRIAANTGVGKREGKITFSSGQTKETVTVYQDGEDPVMVLTKDRYEVGAEGDTIQIEIQSNADYEMQLPAVNWIEEVQSRSVSTHTRYILIRPNDTYEERSAEICFVNKSTDETEKVTVVQKQKDGLLVTSDKVEVSNEGGDISIEVQSNIDYVYEIEEAAQSWITKVESRGLTSHIETFNVAANYAIGKREGKITFRSGEHEETVTVYQGGEEPVLVLTQNQYEVGAEGDTLKIEIKSNADYEMQLPSVDWMEEATTRTVSMHTHYIVIHPNDSYGQRSAEILFVNSSAHIKEKVSIVQKQNDALLVSSDWMEVSSNGGNVTFEIRGNVDYECVIEDDAQSWISQTGTRALSTHRETFRIAKNMDIQSREGKITFRNGDVSATVTVSQKGADPVFTLTRNWYEVGAGGETIQIVIQSNADYEMQLPAVDWLAEEVTRAVSDYSHRIVIQPNETYDKRSALILFSCPAAEKSDTVHIAQKQKDLLLVTPNELEVSCKGDEVTVEVQSNFDYVWSIDSAAKSWITHIGTRGVSSGQLTFRISENTDLQQREGKITFSGNGLTAVVKVTQGSGSGENNGGIQDMPTHDW
jgi:hypothetical protein